MNLKPTSCLRSRPSYVRKSWLSTKKETSEMNHRTSTNRLRFASYAPYEPTSVFQAPNTKRSHHIESIELEYWVNRRDSDMICRVGYRCQERFCNESRPGIELAIVSNSQHYIYVPLRTYKQLHLRYFLVDLFHKLNDKIDKLVLQHVFCVEIGDQERDIVSLGYH